MDDKPWNTKPDEPHDPISVFMGGMFANYQSGVTNKLAGLNKEFAASAHP